MKKICLVAGIALVGMALCANANLLNNASFEEEISWDWNSGSDVTNWNAWAGTHRADSGWATAQDGGQSMVIRNWEGAGGGFEQKPAVDADTTYAFSSWSLTHDGFNGTVDVIFDWLDAGYASLGQTETISMTLPTVADVWQQFSVSVTSVAGAENVEVKFENPAGGSAGWMLVDSVDFDVAAIPEPATALLLIMGCGGLAWFRKRKA